MNVSKQQALKLRHKAQGLCVECSKVAAYPSIRCTEHIETSRKSLIKPHEQQKITRKEGGYCLRCGCPMTDDVNFGYLTCVNCRSGIDRGWN
jgi:hypothetical protein